MPAKAMPGTDAGGQERSDPGIDPATEATSEDTATFATQHFLPSLPAALHAVPA